MKLIFENRKKMNEDSAINESLSFNDWLMDNWGIASDDMSDDDYDMAYAEYRKYLKQDRDNSKDAFMFPNHKSIREDKMNESFDYDEVQEAIQDYALNNLISIRTMRDEGYKGYLDINTLGLKLVNKGGYLVTCSCSQHLTLNLFLKMINEAISHSNIKAKLVNLSFQGKDHASLLNMDEALYLKVAVIQVM